MIKEYDLEERTAKFGEDLIDLLKKVPRNEITIPIISQLTKSGTSIGANYCEANGASSKRDFKNKIHICKKESLETKFWLRMLARAVPKLKKELGKLWKEANELTKIFSQIIETLKKKK